MCTLKAATLEDLHQLLMGTPHSFVEEAILQPLPAYSSSPMCTYGRIRDKCLEGMVRYLAEDSMTLSVFPFVRKKTVVIKLGCDDLLQARPAEFLKMLYV